MSYTFRKRLQIFSVSNLTSGFPKIQTVRGKFLNLFADETVNDITVAILRQHPILDECETMSRIMDTGYPWVFNRGMEAR